MNEGQEVSQSNMLNTFYEPSSSHFTFQLQCNKPDPDVVIEISDLGTSNYFKIFHKEF